MQQFREQNVASLSQRMKQAPPSKSTSQVVAELRARANGNPEMTKRVEQMAQRLEAVDALKTASAALAKANGNEKAKAQDDFRKARENLTKIQQNQMAVMKAEQAAGQQAEAIRPMSPEMAAMKAKVDLRMQEIEQMRASLQQAKPEDRTKILGAWRTKQTQELQEPINRR